MPSRRATMKDVAVLAGVSPKTVSNVITEAFTVRDETRARVEAAMDELDFVPNLSARGLRNGRSGIFALALPDTSTAFSGSLIRAGVAAAHERGLVMHLEDTLSAPEREYSLVSRARTHQIDGLILNPVRLSDSVVEHVAHLPPVVLIGEVEQHRTDRVFVNSRAAGRTLAEHMIAQGARRIAVVGGAPAADGETATMQQRIAGVDEALIEAGLDTDPRLRADAQDWSITGGATGMRTLLERRVDFDALICFTDSIALGALHELRVAGLRVPEDVLVSGVDDVEHAAFAGPPLTTIRFDHHRYMASALDLLATRFDDRSSLPQAVEIPYELVVRESTQTTPRGTRFS